MIVVDTNVIAYVLIENEFTPAARRLAENEAAWHAPHLWRSEMRNVVIGEMRRGRISGSEAVRTMQRAEALMSGRSHMVSTGTVLALAGRSRCSAYDLEFVALAEQLGVPLVTMDRQILREFPDIARPLA
ncbi:MAG: type II toxin-antitoxin system VapC family toxin [Terriglobales bacterium]